MIKEQLLSKNGTATMKLSRELLKYSIGERIPTISEFVENIHLARGTIQNALRNLVDSKAIAFESQGIWLCEVTYWSSCACIGKSFNW